MRLATAISISFPRFLSCATSCLVSATSASSFRMERITTSPPASRSRSLACPLLAAFIGDGEDVSDGGEDGAEYIGTVAGMISSSASAIGFGEKVMVLLLLLASCLALEVGMPLALALGVAMAATLLLCLEWPSATRMRSPNTATASLTDRNGQAVSTSARSEAAAMPEQPATRIVASPRGLIRTASNTSTLEEYMEPSEAGFFASTSIARWPLATSSSNQFPNSNKQGA